MTEKDNKSNQTEPEANATEKEEPKVSSAIAESKDAIVEKAEKVLEKNNDNSVFKNKKVIGSIVGAAVAGAIIGGAVIAHSNQNYAFQIDGHSYTSKSVLDDLSKSDTAVSSYKSILVRDALETRYDSKDINSKVNSQFKTIRSQYSTKTQWQQYLTAQGLSDEAAVKKSLKSSLMLQEYLNSKTTDAQVKSAYDQWIPTQQVYAKLFDSKKDADEALSKYTKTDKQSEISDYGDKNEYTQAQVNSLQGFLSSANVKSLYATSVGTASVFKTNITGSNGTKQYAVVIYYEKANKASFAKEKSAIKSALQAKATSDTETFGKEFVKDFKIKATSDFGTKVIKAIQSTAPSSAGN